MTRSKAAATSHTTQFISGSGLSGGPLSKLLRARSLLLLLQTGWVGRPLAVQSAALVTCISWTYNNGDFTVLVFLLFTFKPRHYIPTTVPLWFSTGLIGTAFLQLKHMARLTTHVHVPPPDHWFWFYGFQFVFFSLKTGQPPHLKLTMTQSVWIVEVSAAWLYYVPTTSKLLLDGNLIYGYLFVLCGWLH